MMVSDVPMVSTDFIIDRQCFYDSRWPVFFEDNHLLAVYKPAGLLVQGDRTGDICLLDLAKRWLKVLYQKPGKVFLGMVHRLDRPVAVWCCLPVRPRRLHDCLNSFVKERSRKHTWPWWKARCRRRQDAFGIILNAAIAATGWSLNPQSAAKTPACNMRCWVMTVGGALCESAWKPGGGIRSASSWPTRDVRY